MWDKNEVPCCTKKLELFESWQKEGYVEGHEPYIQFATNKNWLRYISQHELQMKPKYVYSVRRDYGRSKWNFVCPTHHPVPTVAILLGMFKITIYRPKLQFPFQNQDFKRY